MTYEQRLKKQYKEYLKKHPDVDIYVLNCVVSTYWNRITDVFKVKFHNGTQPTMTVPHIGTFSANKRGPKPRVKIRKKIRKKDNKHHLQQQLKSKEYILF